MLPLAEVHGPYPVGTTTFACNPSPTVIGNAKVRTADGQLVNLLRLDEVAFTAYYPADTAKPTRKGVPWLYRPVYESLTGFSKISGIARWILWPVIHIYGRMVTIPVHRNAPLLAPPGSEKGASEWPLVIFSHGLSGSSTAYSTVCSRIASSGRVVLALEHHDGTAVAFHTESRQQFYVREKEVIVADGEKLRTDQLTFRRQEIYLAFQYFKQLIQNDWSVEPAGSRELYVKDGSSLDWSSFAGTNTVNFASNVTAAGHSFGGATILSLLSTSAPSAHARIPVSHALLHDPWMDPLPTPGPAPFSDSPSKHSVGLPEGDSAPSQGSSTTNVASLSDSKDTIASQPRLLIINSETFTLWSEHYNRLIGILENWDAASKPLTIVRSVHMSFSDFKLLPLVRNKNNSKIMDVICDLSIGFLDDKVDTIIKRLSPIPLETEPVKKSREGSSNMRIRGEVGQVAIL